MTDPTDKTDRTDQPPDLGADPGDLEAEFVVVGSGAGGGPLACRLARAGHTVILLEAGPAEVPLTSKVPAFHGIAAEDPDISWEYFVRHYDDPDKQAADSKYVDGKGIFYPRAATIGGCTTHNALITVAPHNSDWDAIAELMGDQTWCASSMRAYFQRMEHCHYVAEPGAARPRPVLPLALWAIKRLVRAGFRAAGVVDGDESDGHGFKGWLHTNLADAWLVAKDVQLLKVILRTAARAIAEDLDDNVERFAEGVFDPNCAGLEDDDEGFTLVPLATRDGCRNGPREFIEETARLFPDNLRVVTDALATRVVLERDTPTSTARATAVEFLHGARLYRADPNCSGAGGVGRVARATREVIVAAGAFNTPQLLMLSGIGARDGLSAHGIDVVVESPGVGTNLQDRYEVAVIHRFENDFALTRELGFKLPAAGQPKEPAWTDWECAQGPYTTNGVVLAVVKKSAKEGPADLFIFGVPAEFTGYYPRYSDDAFTKRDRFTWAVLKAHTNNRGGRVTLRSTDPRDTPDVTFRYFEEGTGDAHADLDAVVHGVEFVRRTMNDWTDAVEELVPGNDVQDTEALRDFIRRESWGHHASCSAPMGPDGDPNAVLDSRLRVRGVDGLRVVDASIFPRIPGFFIVTAIYMASEKAADMIIADHRSAGSIARMGVTRTKAAAGAAVDRFRNARAAKDRVA